MAAWVNAGDKRRRLGRGEFTPARRTHHFTDSLPMLARAEPRGGTIPVGATRKGWKWGLAGSSGMREGSRGLRGQAGGRLRAVIHVLRKKPCPLPLSQQRERGWKTAHRCF